MAKLLSKRTVASFVWVHSFYHVGENLLKVTILSRRRKDGTGDT